jgi:methylated-DNA-[protein]-cysteine S-methyltransferase
MPTTTRARADAPLVHRLAPSPLGPLRLVGRGGVLHGLYMQTHRHAPPAAGRRVDTAFSDVATQLDAYFAGQLTTFDVAYELLGTPFQRTVWEALTTIPYGETISYGELARRLGSPSASRAVGLANGRNPISIIVPCHRVIGADGSLTGYGGGVDRKRLLLDLERRHGGTTLF